MLEINKKYRFVISLKSRELYYTGKVTSIDVNFVTFIDLKDRELTYNLSSITSYEEVKNG